MADKHTQRGLKPSATKSLPQAWRKKPVVIEAMRVNKGLNKAITAWCGARPIKWLNKVVWFQIDTLEGDMKANIGDYIIKGVHGEFYPCKPDIFLETYEKVTDMLTDDSEATDE